MKVLITGSAGFIGFHLANLLLKSGFKVCGYDGLTPYYDIKLKKKRNEILSQHSNFESVEGMLEDKNLLEKIFDDYHPDIVVHLAAQAGVRYSLENPRSYIDSNIVGTFNIMEMAKKLKIKHLLMASTSSVYGSNDDMPFKETSKADTTKFMQQQKKQMKAWLIHMHIYGYSNNNVCFYSLWSMGSTRYGFI